jgi:hypothetical protein
VDASRPTKKIITKAIFFLTTQPPITLQLSPTKQATWYLLHTVTFHTSANQKHEVKQEAIFFMSSYTKDPANNGAVLNITHIIKSVMSLAAKAKLGALYMNACKAILQHQLLEEMGHTQLPTPMQIDNSTAL